MRHQSQYEFECVCGALITSHSITGICGGCKRKFVLVWQADYKTEEHSLAEHGIQS